MGNDFKYLNWLALWEKKDEMKSDITSFYAVTCQDEYDAEL